ncbi:GumC family protein [Paraburkholderia acidisoli]|uniref:Tyrosine-protein kinase G-rich domain-containing protein n=1 Tax=Paraburkholderia acidisoli TaxID=2571748 RepID=A0A7Z2JDK8_9BURK|nr:GNVR domain-containing protein [Paraburkholderia acidisoli]QGZ60696.1 hypothetical protein FAZ98_02490 [Paraburkholderia acidisoli]
MEDTQATTMKLSEDQQPITKREYAQEISVFDILVLLGEQKRVLFGTVFAAMTVSIAGSLLWPAEYTGKTVLLPPQQNKSALSLLSGLGSLADIGGAIGGKSPDGTYVGLLQSNVVADDLTARFKLKERYSKHTTEDVRKELRDNVKVSSDRQNGFITIEVTDRSPIFAATLANAYVDELRKQLNRLAVTDAQQRTRFFQAQIDQTLDRLSVAESTFDLARKKGGVVSLDGQVASSIQAAAQLRAKITASEIELQSMRTYETQENPEVQKTLAAIGAMREQLASLEGGASSSSGTGKDDTAALANIRAFREVKYEEAVLDQFRQQLELAKVDEAKEGPLVQQIDSAIPPEKKSAPHRALIILAGSFLGVVLGLLIAFSKAIAARESAFRDDLSRVVDAWRPARSSRSQLEAGK